VRLAVPVRLETTYRRDCAGDGRWVQLAAQLHAAVLPSPPPVALKRAPPKPKNRTYVVRKGDSLAKIARTTGCGSSHDIAVANGLRAPHYAIKPGQVLKLGKCPR
jgi:membrane-bound lytic murein transglycosylase D